MAKEDKTDGLNFWEHLDVLRTAIVKIVAVAVVFGIAAFCFKEKLLPLSLPRKTTASSRTVFSTGLQHGPAARPGVLPCSSSTRDWPGSSSST